MLATHIQSCMKKHTESKQRVLIELSEFSIGLLIDSWGTWEHPGSLYLTWFFSFLYRLFDGSFLCNGELLPRYPRSGSLKGLRRICVSSGSLGKYGLLHEHREQVSDTHRGCQGNPEPSLLSSAMWGRFGRVGVRPFVAVGWFYIWATKGIATMFSPLKYKAP